MIPLSEAQQFVLESIAQTKTINVQIDDALGMITTETLVSLESIPPHDNTAMDGFAITEADRLILERTEELRLPIRATIPAGSINELIIHEGEAARIMTGAPIPVGTSCIVIVEDTKADGDFVKLSGKYRNGENIRRAGSDIKHGDQIFQSGTRIDAAHVGVLASVGFHTVPAHRRPRIGVISTGDELIDGSTKLTYGQIRDSNRHSLMAIVRSTGAIAVDLGIVPDDEARLAAAFESAALDLDAIVTSGGVSVGDFDYTKAILSKLSGGTARWMQIAIRPAKPFAFGLISSTPFFALPGNPVSALVSFELLVRPAIRKMMGSQSYFNRTILAKASNSYQRGEDGKTHYVRAHFFSDDDGNLHVESLDKQSSHMLHEMSRANSLAIVPNGRGFEAGNQIRIMPLAWNN